MGQIVKKATGNRSFIAELMSKREETAVARSEIRNLVEDLNKQDVFIESVDQVRRLVKEKLDLEVNRRRIRLILRKDLKMRYKLVKPLSWMTNSHKNLILRQQFAAVFLNIDLSKKVVLNIEDVVRYERLPSAKVASSSSH